MPPQSCKDVYSDYIQVKMLVAVDLLGKHKNASVSTKTFFVYFI